MWEPDSSPRTPILYEHWISEGAFACYGDGSAGTFPVQQLSAEDFHTPVSSRTQSYVIIPLHTPPKNVKENVAKSPQGSENKSPLASAAHPPMVISETGTQAHRRSPEKRFPSPGPICRICHEGDLDETLLSPCNCNGSLQLVHKSCLEKWLSTSNSDSCEICTVQLPVRKVARPIWQWFGMTNSTHGPQGFYADLTCVILLTPICLLSIYLCGIGAADYMRHGVWEGTGLAFLSGFLLCTYLAWCYITIRFHWKTLKRWRTLNQVVYLIDKDIRRSNGLRKQNSVSATPRNSLIASVEWNSPPEVRVFSSSFNHEQENLSNGDSTTNVNPLDMSFTGFNIPAPAFL